MNLKGQHIGRLITFLAGLIILAHTVVPHHHHFELIHSSEQEPTCENPSQEKNNESPGSHCHAFNILLSERTNNFSSKTSLSEHFSFYLNGIITNIEILPVKSVTAIIFGYKTIFLKQFFFSACSHRAPPANASLLF